MSVGTPEQAALAASAAAASIWVDQAAAGTAAVAGRATAYAARLLQQFSGWYSPAEIRAMSGELAALSLDAQAAVASMMADYVAQTVSLLADRPVQPPRLPSPVIRNGVPLEVVHQRPMTSYRIDYADTKSIEAAIDAAIEREIQLLEADIMLAVREAERDAMVDLGVTKYRRVLRPERSTSGSCLLCVAASLNVYKAKDLLPIHNGCKCIVMPIIDGQDPGDEINEEDRRLAYAESGTTDRDELRKLRVNVREHGELGPVLTDEGHHFTGPKQVKAGSYDVGRPTEKLEEALAKLERSQEKFASDGTRRRIAELRAELALRGGNGGGDDSPPDVTVAGAADPDPLERMALGERIDAHVTTAHPLTTPPPTFDKVAPHVAKGDPLEHFLPDERATAGRLAAAEPDIALISVAELDKVLPKSDRNRRGPDAVLAGTRHTVELKTLQPRAGEAPANAIKRQLRVARTQSRVAVVDGVEQGLSRDEAVRGLRGAVGTYGNDFDLIVILLDDGSAVHWRHA